MTIYWEFLFRFVMELGGKLRSSGACEGVHVDKG